MSALPGIVRSMPTIRWVAMACVVTFTFVVLGAMAHYIALETSSPHSLIDPFAELGLAVAIITLLLVNPMIFVDFFRRGAFTSMIVTELSVIGFLLIMWLATAAYTSSVFQPVAKICSQDSNISIVQSVCTDIQLGMAFGWLNWILLLAYWIILLTMAILASKNGKPVWKLAVRGNDFGYSSKRTATPLQDVGIHSTDKIVMHDAKSYNNEASPLPVNALSYDAPQVNVTYNSPRPDRATGYAGYNPTITMV